MWFSCIHQAAHQSESFCESDNDSDRNEDVIIAMEDSYLTENERSKNEQVASEGKEDQFRRRQRCELD
jgi:hypothetical protein